MEVSLVKARKRLQKQLEKEREPSHKKISKISEKKKVKGSVIMRFTHFIFLTMFQDYHGTSFLKLPDLDLDRKKFMRSHVREFLGTQQPTITCRTGQTAFTTTGGSSLQQVIAMDVTGVAGWTSFAGLFDEYRVKKAKVLIMQRGYPLIAATIANACIVTAIDYDDGATPASSDSLIAYDTFKIMFWNVSSPKVLKTKEARPEGQPDLAWVTTATPTIPFWFKFRGNTVQLPASSTIADGFIECDIEFRQLY